MLVCLEERMAWRGLSLCGFLVGGCREVRLLEVQRERVRADAAAEILSRNIRKDFTVRKVNCWRRLLRETVETGDAQSLTRQD